MALSLSSGVQRRLASVLGLGALLSASAVLAQSVQFSPSDRVLAGEPFAVVLEGLPPGDEVTVQARRMAPDFTGQIKPYQAQAVFKVNPQGQVRLAEQAPLSGSYEGVDGRGLLWAMKLQPGPLDAGRTPAQTEYTVLHQGRAVASGVLHLLRSLPEVQERAVPGFEGAKLAALPGNTRRPALILLGGSEGGSLVTRDAAVWASRGYAVLALPYYSPAGWGPQGPTPSELPSLPASFANIPLERLQAARDWLVQQPEVDGQRIGVMGTSKGAEFALLAAVRMPWIKAVAAIVPTDVVWEGWGPGVAEGRSASFAWQGQSLPFVPYQGFQQEFAGFATGQPVRIRRPHDQGRAVHAERVEAARIPVEKIAAPVFLAGAGDDQIWASGAMTEALAQTRQKAGLPTVSLVFAQAGHFLGGTGTASTQHYNDGPMKSGGTPAATARAQAQTFEALKAFWKESLVQ